MAEPKPSTASTPRRRFDPTPLQRSPTAGAAPVPRAKDIVLIQRRLRIREPSTSQKLSTKTHTVLPKQKPKQTIAKQTRTQSASLTIKTLFQRQLSVNGSASAEPDGSQITSVSDETTTPSCMGHAAENLVEFDSFKYASDMAREVASGTRSLGGDPCIYPSSPFEAMELIQRRKPSGTTLNHAEVMSCVLKPKVFVWHPEMICPTWRLPCPDCMKPTSFSAWATPRIVHSLTESYVYICTIHACSQCSASRARQRFRADRPDILARAPPAVTIHWKFVNTGKTLCEAPVRDYVRAMATRTSWNAIADGLNEMKRTKWTRSVSTPYVNHANYRRPATHDLYRILEHWNQHITHRSCRNLQNRRHTIQLLLASDADNSRHTS